MIRNIVNGSKYINVSGGYATNYVNNLNGAQGVGNMRFNTTNQNIEVYDGVSWNVLNMREMAVGLDWEAESLLDWAKKKRDEEMELEALAETNSTIKDLVNTIKQKEEQIRIVRTLIKKETTV